MKKLVQQLEQKPYILALTIVLLLLIWMSSGSSQASDETAPTAAEKVAKVQVVKLVAQDLKKTLSFYGKSQPDKLAKVSARQAGEVEKIYVEEGQFVKQGELILELDKSDLDAQIGSATALLKQYTAEYEGALSLRDQGLQDRVQTMRSEAVLAQGKARLAGLELQLQRTEIRAPFSGIINKRIVQIGDYVGVGDAILELADLDPLVVRADATQKEIVGLAVGQSVHAHVLNDKTYPGKIRYIASVADENTNTFRIEAAFSNPSMAFKAGFSTQLDIELQSAPAMLLSPAYMALDDEGNIGVKIIDENNRVVFKRVELAKSSAQGVWLWGLGDTANVITLGQGFVREGDIVEPVYIDAADKTGE
ncbi:efflux RND transporter periplasmic adaptor subunit [Pseudoalteromonas shioyasakiensis]|uniref:efflux RND transporter periplasmic adaptor subunit n=1 Tax=Pseudoalteromonas shioyasakiensis TaxID=1190813 RepID=UPI002118F998|nr:efflux RND transporter periplasmic adaptor subunit [Pseudoalteromonas shioyasakiensis]MCQ8878082.1 efflux RND transporter periplasmic adaptor subunit [Pseudoalteromonas shioyasakiensis]